MTMTYQEAFDHLMGRIRTAMVAVDPDEIHRSEQERHLLMLAFAADCAEERAKRRLQEQQPAATIN